MSVSDAALRELTAVQAADWFVANRAGLSSKERQQFTAWLTASPLHVEEYLAVSVVACDLREACEPLRDSIDGILKEAIPSGVRRRVTWAWQPSLWVIAAAAILGVGLLI